MGLGYGYYNGRANGLAPSTPQFGGCLVLQFEEKTYCFDFEVVAAPVTPVTLRVNR
jgi:hypothetical protein